VPFDGRAERDKRWSARNHLERCQLSGIDLARFCPENSQKKIKSGGRMRETSVLYPVYACKPTEGHGGLKGVFTPQMSFTLYLGQ
jgi:hypothetical protein